MNILKSIIRLRTSLSTETNPDVVLTTRAILRGMINYHKGHIDDTIRQNASICESCEYNVEDTDDDMKVIDTDFEALSDRMCSDCGGCSLPFKVRQTLKPCRLWLK